MNDMNHKSYDQELDPDLQALLDEIRPTAPRNPQAAAQGQARFLSELDSLLPQIQAAAPQKMTFTQRVGESLRSLQFGFGQRAALTALVAVIVVLAVLFGGAGMTAYAARSALPGDALYGVKTRLEVTQVRFARDAAQQFEMHLKFAQRRLDEIEKLVAEGRYNDIKIATQEFQVHIQNALQALKGVAAGDPLQAADLSALITEELTRYAQVLGNLVVGVPETVRPELERALQVSNNALGMEGFEDREVEITGAIEQIGPDAWVIAGQVVRLNSQTEIKGSFQPGFLVRVRAMRNADQSLTALEIILVRATAGNENANGNTNMNANDNQNMNANGNDNDDSGNDNGNSNFNYNTNDNQNDDSDDRSNDNDNDNDNQNENDNVNDNNQNSNDNDNDDDNSNDNDDEDDEDDRDNNNEADQQDNGNS